MNYFSADYFPFPVLHPNYQISSSFFFSYCKCSCPGFDSDRLNLIRLPSSTSNAKIIMK